MALSDHLTGMVLFNSSTQKGYFIESAGVVKEIKSQWDGATVTSGTITTLGSTTINATTINATTVNAALTGTVTTAAQPNITSIGAMTGLDVNGYSDIAVTGSEVGLKVGGSNASFASELQQLVTTRASSSSFKFLATRSSGGSDVEHNLRGDGNGYCDGSWIGGGADFAEYMEWEDGNPLGEDRTGKTVAIGIQDSTGHITPKIKLAETGDIVIGAVSANPTIIGNSDWNKWQGKYLKNKYEGYLLDDHGNRQLNPDWVETSYEDHLPRSARKEWASIGIVGFVIIDDDQPTNDNWVNFGSLGGNVSRWLLK
jgi:hypothetical protein